MSIGSQIIFFIFFANRYNREEVVRSLGKEVNLNPPLTLGQLPDTPEELLKLDQVSFMGLRNYRKSSVALTNLFSLMAFVAGIFFRKCFREFIGNIFIFDRGTSIFTVASRIRSPF